VNLFETAAQPIIRRWTGRRRASAAKLRLQLRHKGVDHPLYSGNSWFLPMVGGYYRLRDRLDRLLA
jgi:hypothetical protein